MLNIVNKQIKHTVFGEGKVISQSESKLSIEFSEKYGTKGFVYPDAFEKYLKLADDKAQASVMDDQMYELYDASGRIIQTGHLNTISDGIKVPFLSTGIYLLHLTGQDSFARFIVNRVRR